MSSLNKDITFANIFHIYKEALTPLWAYQLPCSIPCSKNRVTAWSLRVLESDWIVQGSWIGDLFPIPLFFLFCSSFPMSTSIGQGGVGVFVLCLLLFLETFLYPSPPSHFFPILFRNWKVCSFTFGTMMVWRDDCSLPAYGKMIACSTGITS